MKCMNAVKVFSPAPVGLFTGSEGAKVDLLIGGAVVKCTISAYRDGELELHVHGDVEVLFSLPEDSWDDDAKMLRP